MWINKKEYKRLLDEKQSFEASLRHRITICRELAERTAILTDENMKLRQEVDQLKVKYFDEVEKNFKLSSYLSENQSQ